LKKASYTKIADLVKGSNNKVFHTNLTAKNRNALSCGKWGAQYFFGCSY